MELKTGQLFPPFCGWLIILGYASWNPPPQILSQGEAGTHSNAQSRLAPVGVHVCTRQGVRIGSTGHGEPRLDAGTCTIGYAIATPSPHDALHGLCCSYENTQSTDVESTTLPSLDTSCTAPVLPSTLTTTERLVAVAFNTFFWMVAETTVRRLFSKFSLASCSNS